MPKSRKIENSKTEFPGKDQLKDELNREDFIALIHQSIQHFSGPLPSPEILKEYNEALPDAAERIFKMAEKPRHITTKQSVSL